MYNEEKNKCKIVLVGDSNTGKSSLIYSLVNNIFLEESLPTIGISFNVKIIKNKDTELDLEIWDTAGSEVYRALSKLYYREADYIFLCFDLSNEDTFLNLHGWILNIKDNCSNKNVIIYIIGTKSDLKQEISQDKIDKLCQEYNFIYIKTSSKNNIVNHIIDYIITDFNTIIKPLRIKNNKNNNNNILLNIKENIKNSIKPINLIKSDNSNNKRFFCW
tara:strand:+ start:260 stop:913 length:654 start_codon:yes stop_codon:yes gene_type:complete